MLRRQARLRREYIYKKTIEQRQKTVEDKKKRLKQAIDGRKIFLICSTIVFFLFL
jgi:U3 small nucleolar ribonucleoprotein protein IMP4